jgi:hypothetical protein
MACSLQALQWVPIFVTHEFWRTNLVHSVLQILFLMNFGSQHASDMCGEEVIRREI